MDLKRQLQRLLDLLDGHEDELAEAVSKRTSVSKEQAKTGLEKAQELAGPGSSEGDAGSGGS